MLDLELKHQTQESNLSYELEKARREHQMQMDAAHQLSRDSAIKDKELQRLSQRLEESQVYYDLLLPTVSFILSRYVTVRICHFPQVVVGDKTQQLEDLLNQLEKAELKAAKEARQRMELERLTRRFRNPSSSSSSSSYGAPPDSLLHGEEEKQQGVPPLTVDTSLATPPVSTQSNRTATRITPRISSITRAVREHASPVRTSSSASSPKRQQGAPLDSPSKHRASSTPSGAAMIQRAFSATNRIEQAMQAKGWTIKASKSLH